MTVNKERLQLGLDTLRSGEFEQTTGALRQVFRYGFDVTEKVVTKYCCLGVLTEVAIRNGLTIEDFCVPCQGPLDQCEHSTEEGTKYTSDVWELNTGTLSEPVRKWYGFENEDPGVGRRVVSVNGDNFNEDIRATIANDDLKWDFGQIADGFEKMHLTPEADGDARPAE